MLCKPTDHLSLEVKRVRVTRRVSNLSEISMLMLFRHYTIPVNIQHPAIVLCRMEENIVGYIEDSKGEPKFPKHISCEALRDISGLGIDPSVDDLDDAWYMLAAHTRREKATLNRQVTTEMLLDILIYHFGYIPKSFRKKFLH